MNTPSITAAQVVALVSAVVGLIVAFGVHLSKDERDGIIQVVTVGFPVFLGADALIRHGRSRALAIPPRPPVNDEPAVPAVPPAHPDV